MRKRPVPSSGSGSSGRPRISIPAQTLDLERVHPHLRRRKGAVGVVLVDRLRDRLEILGLRRCHLNSLGRWLGSESQQRLSRSAWPALAGLACGGGDGDSSTGPSAAALAKVRASDYARAVNLHASDVPYFEPIPDDEEEDPKEARKHDRELMRCVGVEEAPEPLAEVKSPEFGTDSPGELLRVASTVEVGADAERAMRELRAHPQPARRALPAARLRRRNRRRGIEHRRGERCFGVPGPVPRP